jgi:hypothetical protein
MCLSVIGYCLNMYWNKSVDIKFSAHDTYPVRSKYWIRLLYIFIIEMYSFSILQFLNNVIIIKAKLLLPHAWMTLTLWFIAPKHFQPFGCPIFRAYRIRVVCNIINVCKIMFLYLKLRMLLKFSDTFWNSKTTIWKYKSCVLNIYYIGLKMCWGVLEPCHVLRCAGWATITQFLIIALTITKALQ